MILIYKNIYECLDYINILHQKIFNRNLKKSPKPLPLIKNIKEIDDIDEAINSFLLVRSAVNPFSKKMNSKRKGVSYVSREREKVINQSKKNIKYLKNFVEDYIKKSEMQFENFPVYFKSFLKVNSPNRNIIISGEATFINIEEKFYSLMSRLRKTGGNVGEDYKIINKIDMHFKAHIQKRDKDIYDIYEYFLNE